MTGGLGLTLLGALGAALILGAVAHRLRLPPMFGYIVAGLVVGPFTPGLVVDRGQVLELADLGVALLMFSLGLRFSVGKLAAAGLLSMLGAPAQVAVTTALGMLLMSLLGRPPLEAFLLGAMVSTTSSVVMVKVTSEAELETTQHGRIALSWSLVQDLLTVLMVVVVGALAVESPSPALEAARSVAIAVVFVVAVVVLGSRVLPGLLARVARLASRELFVIAVAVIAIGMATLASALGVSVALGAFVAGLTLSESDLAASVLGEVIPLRELFATLFFVSIGILLEPAALAGGWQVALLLLALIVIAKWLVTAGIGLGARRGPIVSFRVAGLMPQCGEFTFVLATAGLQLGVIDTPTFSLAMGATIVSILLAAPNYRLSAWIGDAFAARGLLRPALRGPEPDTAGLRRHAVILGFGNVGRSVARTLETRGFKWVAIDADYSVVRQARERGEPVIFGDAGQTDVLHAAGIDEALVMVLAIPDALAARQAIEHARQRNRRIECVARAATEAEAVELRRFGAGRVIVPQHEIGVEMLRYTLRRFGVGDREIDVVVRRWQ
jgi:CPA2 family monovalent cation:H+ antiporter-2